MKYNKSWTDIGSQIQKLRKRGMIIEDKALAEHYLMNVGYYRLVGYWWPMQADKVTHFFKPGSKFENVVGLYNFDRELRLLLFDVIERIEIGFRSRLNYYVCAEVSPWWFEDPIIFKNAEQHHNTLESIDKELKRSREPFIKDHYVKYHRDKRRPPAWKTLEIASFGNISKLYGNLRKQIKITKRWKLLAQAASSCCCGVNFQLAKQLEDSVCIIPPCIVISTPQGRNLYISPGTPQNPRVTSNIKLQTSNPITA